MVIRKTKTRRTADGSVTTTTTTGPNIVKVTRTKTPSGTLTETHIRYVHSDEPRKSKS